MRHQDALGLAAVALLFSGAIAGIRWASRRAEKHVLQEWMTGQLPVRRSPSKGFAMNPVLATTAVAFWAFVPLLFWCVTARLARFLTPGSARTYLAPAVPFSQAIRWNPGWLLLWAGYAVLGSAAEWLCMGIRPRLNRWLTDPAVSRAEELMKAGELDAAIRGLREAIDADGPSVERWNVLADILMMQERWPEALKVSLDIADRRYFPGNRGRQALALCKLGLPEVALTVLKGTTGTEERKLAVVCSYCEALIDLGLFDRAWYQLHRAEVMYGRGAIPDAGMPRLRKRIDACRMRLAEHFPAEKPSVVDEL